MKNKPAIFIFILSLLVFHGLNNYIILTHSRYCLGPDSVAYIERTIKVSQALREVRLNPDSMYNAYIQIFKGWRPPLFFFMTMPFLSTPVDKNRIAMANMIAFAVILFATYGIGKSLYGREVGALSAFLVSMFPVIFGFSRVLMLEFTLAAMVSLTFYLFVLNKFNSIKFSLLTGVVIGLGGLTKFTYFVFLSPMLAYFFIKKSNLNKRIIRNFIFMIILGLAISALYYIFLSNSEKFPHIFRLNDPNDVFFYLFRLIDYELLPVFFGLFVISIAFYLKRKDYALPLIVAVLLISFSMIRFKGDRYILPVFPFIAIMIANSVWSFPKAGKTISVILAIFSLLQYLAISYGDSFTAKSAGFFRYHSKRLSANLAQEDISENGLLSMIDQGDWQGPCEEIISIASDKRRATDSPINVLFIGQDHRIPATMAFLRLNGRLPISFQAAEVNEAFLYPEKLNTDYSKRIAQSDFIFIQNVPPEERWITTRHLFDAFEQDFGEFSFIKVISFPGNLPCFLYGTKK